MFSFAFFAFISLLISVAGWPRICNRKGREYTVANTRRREENRTDATTNIQREGKPPTGRHIEFYQNSNGPISCQYYCGITVFLVSHICRIAEFGEYNVVKPRNNYYELRRLWPWILTLTSQNLVISKSHRELLICHFLSRRSQ